MYISYKRILLSYVLYPIYADPFSFFSGIRGRPFHIMDAELLRFCISNYYEAKISYINIEDDFFTYTLSGETLSSEVSNF